MTSDHRDTIRREFSKQAEGYAGPGLTQADAAGLRWALDNLALHPGHRVLDVAAGTALVGRAIAPYVREVVALDLTPAMLDVGRREAQRAGLANITFQEGDARALPFRDAAFDVVVTRFSVHHFEEPSIVVREMARVCKPGGSVAVIDLVAPDNAALAERYNHWERMRDPSHTTALPRRALERLVGDARLVVQRTASREMEINVARWLDLAKTPLETRTLVLDALGQELKGLTVTGMRPFIKDGERHFRTTWVIVVGTKL
jgi:ubiquinone/menaquinone biosynthesis C-methylase UbiE